MDLILRLAVYVLAFNAFLVCWVVFLRFKIWLCCLKGLDVKDFLASLPRDFKIVDPWILAGDQWVRPAKGAFHSCRII
jgi:hypothetical protein